MEKLEVIHKIYTYLLLKKDKSLLRKAFLLLKGRYSIRRFSYGYLVTT